MASLVLFTLIDRTLLCESSKPFRVNLTLVLALMIPVLSVAQGIKVRPSSFELTVPSDSLFHQQSPMSSRPKPAGAVSQRIDQIGTAFAAPQSLGEMIWTVSLTSLFTFQDRQLYAATQQTIEHSHLLRKTSDAMVKVGNGAYQMGFAGALGLYGYVFDDRRAKETAGQCAEGILIDGFMVQVIKRIAGRESPAAATHIKGRWQMFPNPRYYEKNPARYYSFPSGHISTTVATLTVLFNNYKELRPYKPVAYGLAGLVGMSLVGKGMHWYSDLPLGVFLGYAIGTAVSRSDDAASTESTKAPGLAFTIVPSIQNAHIAMNVSMTF